MKKFSLLFLTAFVTGNNDRIKASRIFFLAFLFCCISNLTSAQVIVTPASGGNALCGPLPACTMLGDIVIDENATTDFAIGIDQVTLIPPTGWEFCGAVPTPTVTSLGTDITVNGTGFTSTSYSFRINATGNSTLDQVKIVGLSVRPLVTTAANGFISASVSTGINGIVPGVTNFGNLGLFPGIITGNITICQGESTVLSSADPGGVWSSTVSSVATIDPSTGVVGTNSTASGTTTIFYTIGLCSSSTVLTVNQNPTPITNIHDICQNVCYNISSTPPTGLFTSTLVTVLNTAPIGTTGAAQLCGVNAGVGTITYTLPTGCFTTTVMTVNPIPQPIIDPLGTYEICAGDTRFLSDATLGGMWSSQFLTIATIDPTFGDIHGIGPTGGITVITYSLTTGCKVDTPFRVYPVPSAIVGTPSVCVGSTTNLSSSTPGGAWTSANINFATVTSGGVVTGVNPGVVMITYTLPAGSCYAVYQVTVNPVPDPITGPNQVCFSYSIQLNTTSVGGTWSSSATFIATVGSTTGLVTGNFAGGGMATISYTFPTGCSALYTVTVNPLPDVITGPTSVCQGQCIFLSDASMLAGGTWDSQFPAFLSIDPITGQACGITVGTFPITFTLNATGCFVTTLIDVYELDTIAGPNTVCERDSILLINNTSGGGTWSSSNVAVATVGSTTGWVYGVTAGVTTISFTTPTGCIDTFLVTVNPGAGPITGPTNVCVGSQITLSDPTAGLPVGSGTWGSTNPVVATAVGGLGNVGIVTGVTAGFSVLITYTLPAGCMSSYLVKVDSLPDPIIGPHEVCKGSVVNLINTYPHAAGVWTVGNMLVDTVDAVGSVYGVDAGTDLITYTLPSGCATTHSMTVHPLDPITGTTSVLCAGDSIVLSNATPGGPGIWSSSPLSVATVGATTGVVYGVHPGGIATIMYTLPTGCFATYTVLVNPQPDPFTGPDSVCQGRFISITSGPSGTWTIGNPLIDTIDVINTTPTTVVIGGVSPGVDILTYTLPVTNCFRTMSITVTPRDVISLGGGDDSVCVGVTITLSNSVGGGVWSSGNTTVATVTSGSGVVTGISAGSVTITYTNPSGCIDTQVIWVKRLPFPITGMDTICAGSSIQLSDADPDGAWSVSPSTTATIDPTGMLFGVQPGGVATITYTLPTSCIITATLLVNPLPSPIVGPSDICITDSTQVFTSATPLGTWSSSSTTIIIKYDTSGLVTPRDTGVAVLTYTLPTGCEITKTITIRPLPVIVVTSPDSVICRGSSTVLTATGAGAFGSYVWSPAASLSSSTGSPVTAFPVVTTTYTVVGTTIYGCSSDTTITVWLDTTLYDLAISADDTEICIGECTQLHVSGGQDSVYLWRPSVGLSCTNCQNPFACPTQTTTYWAVAVNFRGCRDSISFTVVVHPKPVLVVTPNPVIICKRSTTNVNVSGAGPGGHYLWTPNVFINCDTCADVILSDTANIIYEVVGTTQFGCMDSITVKVSVLDTNVNWISNDTIICIGDTIMLRATSQSLTSNLDVPTYVWTPDYNIDNGVSNMPHVWPATTTVYTVVITENVCFKDTLHVQVSVQPLPSITTVPGSATVIAGTSVQLLATAPNVIVSSFAWSPAGTLSCDSCDNPIATPVASVTVYTVTAVSNFGCLYYDTVSIHLFCDNSQIFIPNTFTPNGDGLNDRFYISGKGISKIVRFAIFNRWGQLIYERNNITVNEASAGWDGTFNGLVLPPDVFYYQVSAICELGGEPFTYSGDVSIVR